MDVVCGVVAGLFAATASVSAKLLFEEWDSFVIKSVCFAAFALSNIMMWWSHTKALRNSASTLKVTVLNTGSNFLATAVYALLVFGENRSFTWYVGLALILIGTAVVARSGSINSKDDK